jgi:GNAT superfamily N-acetyltransferase
VVFIFQPAISKQKGNVGGGDIATAANKKPINNSAFLDMLCVTAWRMNFMKQTVSIRRTQQNDAPTLRALQVAALTDVPHAFDKSLKYAWDKTVDKFAGDVRRHSESDIAASFLAFDAAVPAGMIGAFFEQPSRRALVGSLWLRPGYRGLNTGADMLNAAVDWLFARGANVMDGGCKCACRHFLQAVRVLENGIPQGLPSERAALEHAYRSEVVRSIWSGYRDILSQAPKPSEIVLSSTLQ